VSHIGIRSMTRAERGKIRLENVVFARDICLNGLNAAADVIEYLSDKVYVAIHLDVLDPACMPAVGRPEPGGLDWYTLIALIRRVSREKTIVGFDLTGLAPQAGSFPAHLLAAKLVLKTLVYSLHNSV
jgi:agmatinase